VKNKKLERWILTADLAWMPVAFALGYFLRYGSHWYPSMDRVLWTYMPFVSAAMLLWLWLSSWMKLDGFRLGWYFPAVASQLILADLSLILLLPAGGYLARFYISRLLLGYFAALLFLGFLTIRYSINALLRSKYVEGAIRRVLIVGNGPVAREMAAKIARHPEMLWQVVGFLCSEDTALEAKDLENAEATHVSLVGITDWMSERHVDEVIITLSRMGSDVMNMVARCRIQGIRVSVVPRPYELYLSKPELVDVGGLPILQLHQANSAFADSVAKRALDILLCGIFLPVALPLIAVGWVALRDREGGSLLREPRCGRMGKSFLMFRLNSRRDAASVSRLENILQELSITELPQLWNVLVGDMTLVGPRPEAPDRVKNYSDWQRQRLNAKPGITGLAQVHGLREQNSSEEKTRYDLQYMLNSSLFLDISLLMQTAWTLVARLLWALRPNSPAGGDPVAPTRDNLFEGSIPNAHRTQSSTN